ncbi:DNA-directed RNA polymerase sigma-70 factor [Methylopila jiangsuensis]|uniref:RNA polymerase sigma factor n=2 Tax=Methylopila jiangsuensis TaxID=586230 RepID=A0A9W6N391_9HYPH|nr:DNA-directed RNA polymerase sigma-70 factor [Methylopila jiangsuensis]
MPGMTRASADFDVIGELPVLRRYALALTRDPSDAEDLVQDALVRAYDRRAAFDVTRDLRAWLLAILHNVFVDGVRSRRAELIRIAAAGEVAHTHEPPAQEHSIRLAEVRARFRALPEDQRAALHLVAVEGLSYADAAAVVGAPVGTLMSRLARARETLRRHDAGEARPRPGAHLRIVRGTDGHDG